MFTTYCLIKLEKQHNKNYMIEVNDLFYAYPGDKQAVLKGLNFETQKGEIFGFLGPSGAGKVQRRKLSTRF